MSNGGNSGLHSRFKAVPLPTGDFSLVPSDLNILIPAAPLIPIEDRHYLAYIPWERKYIRHIPEQYRRFFLFALPYLHTRTSDVHTALSLAQLPYLIPRAAKPVNIRAVTLAIILHDCGWSQVGQEGLVTSLSYQSVAPTSGHSMKPKQQHLVYGEALAYRLLDAFDFGNDNLSSDDIYEISEIIRRHDHDAAWERGKYGPISMDIKIVCDSDRLWSYTHENFWLDTIRKGVDPETYLETINAEIPSYFFTPQARRRAKQLTVERKTEVEAYLEVLRSTGTVNSLLQEASRPSRQLVSKLHHLVLLARPRSQPRLILRRST